MSSSGEFTPPFLYPLTAQDRAHFNFLDSATQLGVEVTAEEYERGRPLYDELASRLKAKEKRRNLPRTAIILGLGIVSAAALKRKKT